MVSGTGRQPGKGGPKMASPEDVRGRGSTYSVEEFVGRLQDFIARKSSRDSGDDCAIEVTDTGLNLCCPVDTENGIEIECTDILDILKPE
jgi:hypothetical protein